MSSKKHIDTAAALDKPYEENQIGLRAIVLFLVGLLLLIVITFGLMWVFLSLLNDYQAEENARQPNPVRMSEKERLPNEPRLQSAPGFGVDSSTGRVNMELAPPQAEFRELKKQWADLLEHGQKDPKTGVTTIMPINEAKKRLLEQNVKAKSGAEAAEMISKSRRIVTDASAGRVAAMERR